MRLLVAFVTMGIVYLIYGFFVSTYKLNKNNSLIRQNQPYPFFDYRGASNISTTRSLGSGEDREIIEDAKRAGLDFVFITDYNLLDNSITPEAYYGELLILRGAKYSYLDSRLLYYQIDGIKKASNLGEIQVHLTDLLSQRSEGRGETFLVLAHPFLKGYEWTGDWPIGLDGIEVINFKRVQQQNAAESKLSSLMSLLIYPFNPELAFVRLFAEPENEIKLWNTLNQKQIVIGHLGVDATAKAIPFTGSVVKFPNYETLFRLGSEHVLLRSELTGNVMSDKVKIQRALRKGEFYFSLDVLGNPKGFNVLLEDRDQIYLMGHSMKWKNKLKFRIEIPIVSSKAELLVYRDGELISTLPGDTSEFSVEKSGVYRFVVRLNIQLPFPEKSHWIPWIYTNHFYLK